MNFNRANVATTKLHVLSCNNDNCVVGMEKALFADHSVSSNYRTFAWQTIEIKCSI
jgi:aspartate carbamoyltransferase regulatory subunit